ncbi:RNA-directed DNA polymerase, eukaryota [Tanacetum coccineum]
MTTLALTGCIGKWAAINIRDKVDNIDNKAESHPLNSVEIDDRIQWVKLLANFEHQKVKDLRQKAKLKWALEGDENSQFFHGIINNRRNRARINGLNIQGDWVTEHLTIKNHILNFFSNRFNEENCSRPQFTSSLFKQLSQDDIKFLDCSFTTLEIKEAVWDCGSSKSLGPDGFTFTFFKKHWDIVEQDVISYVKDFEVSAHIPKGCNSSFITLVPKVEDPLTIGDFRPISLIGCQYKIIAKILARRLSPVLEIEEVDSVFLDSAYASFLVNGSPTKEFKVERGLSQGDPLSPFLFILAIEALNVAILKATNRDLFHGVKVGKDKFHISHLHFADDALIMGEWSLMKALNLSRILTCFHLASGLKVNFSKSKHFGIRVSNVELYSITSSIGCLASHFPCIYLGLPIGANMSRCNNWKPLVDKFQKRLFKWKSKSLSIGGRVTLIKTVLNSLGVYYFSNFKTPKKIITKLENIRRKFFWGGNNDENKIAWIAWEKVISPRVNGSLGIGSLCITNQALLVKWWWRFCVEDQMPLMRLPLMPNQALFSKLTASASNAPNEENEKGRNPYPISAHLAIYLPRLRCATSTIARPGTKSTIPVCVKVSAFVPLPRGSHNLSP